MDQSDEMEAGADGELSASLTPFDTDVEGALRPRSLGEFIGQETVREQLDLVLTAATRRGWCRIICFSPALPDWARPVSP